MAFVLLNVFLWSLISIRRAFLWSLISITRAQKATGTAAGLKIYYMFKPICQSIVNLFCCSLISKYLAMYIHICSSAHVMHAHIYVHVYNVNYCSDISIGRPFQFLFQMKWSGIIIYIHVYMWLSLVKPTLYRIYSKFILLEYTFSAD